MTKLSRENEIKILKALENNNALKNCILEMIEITQSPLGTLDNGDEAEEAVVNTIQTTGTLLLQQWAQQKNDKAVEEARQNNSYRPHGKKK